MSEFYKIYNFIISNIYRLSAKELNKLLFTMELYHLASTLKRKFNDSRSVKELYLILRQEYK